MFRYWAVALGLKMFSMNDTTRALYRKVGNVLGERKRKRTGIGVRVKRGNYYVGLCDKYDVFNEGAKLLDFGTGWMHWYSIWLRLHYSINVAMFDIWDNRQFGALQSAFSKLKTEYAQNDRIDRRLLGDLLAVNSLAELYSLLGLQYVVEKTGRLVQFQENSFDCVFSSHVFEHVPSRNTGEVIMDMYRILKPGGYSIHQIGIGDHLAHYDRRVSAKNYLRYSDKTWKMLFENQVQYINRLQMSDWLSPFDRAGFSLMEKTINVSCDISSLKIHPEYHRYGKEELECQILTLVHRKPK